MVVVAMVAGRELRRVQQRACALRAPQHAPFAAPAAVVAPAAPRLGSLARVRPLVHPEERIRRRAVPWIDILGLLRPRRHEPDRLKTPARRPRKPTPEALQRAVRRGVG